MHYGWLIGEELLAYVHGSGVAGFGGHEELAGLESEQHAVAAHSCRGLPLQPVGVVYAAGMPKVIPIELRIARPAMPGAPELRAILVAALVQIIGQDAHLLLAVQANARRALLLVAKVAERVGLRCVDVCVCVCADS